MKLIRLILLLFILMIPNRAFGTLTTGSVTIKLAGGDYTTWAGFWDDIGNLTGNITCTVDASAFTESAGPGAMVEELNGHTLTVTADTFPTKTDASDGARFTFNTTDAILIIQMEGSGALTIEGMVFIEGTSEPSIAYNASSIDTDFTFIYRRNIIKGCTDGLLIGEANCQDYKIYNNILYDIADEAIDINYDATSAIIANNTVVHAGDNNFDIGDEEITLENNLAYGASTLDYQHIELLTIGNNNADSDNTGEDADWGGGGANNVPGIGDPFNNLGADDFTITAEGVIGTAGKDLSGSFTTDFFGVTRSNWTIGACEFASASGLEISGIQATEFSGITFTEISGISP